MTFGDNADEAESGRIFEACLEAGVNFIDTADVYSDGVSEEIVGRLIAGRRDDLVIVTKVFGRTAAGVNGGGSSRRHVVRAVEASLRRLNTDRLDYYLLHQFDDSVALEETLHALDDLVRRGLVLYVGASNFAAWQYMKALGISEREGLERFSLIQPMYNLVKRQAEVEILPLALSERLGVISFSPLAAGLLTGRYRDAHRDPHRDPQGDAHRGSHATQGRLVENQRYKLRYGVPAYHQTSERFVDYAAEAGVNPVTLAVSWCASHPAVTAPIIGASSLEQLLPSLAAAEHVMSAAMRAEISALSPEVPPAHDRREEDPARQARP
jgi:aryl-alcohol dehydrogenase-like predicted oxidoreductase